MTEEALSSPTTVVASSHLVSKEPGMCLGVRGINQLLRLPNHSVGGAGRLRKRPNGSIPRSVAIVRLPIDGEAAGDRLRHQIAEVGRSRIGERGEEGEEILHFSVGQCAIHGDEGIEGGEDQIDLL